MAEKDIPIKSKDTVEAVPEEIEKIETEAEKEAKEAPKPSLSFREEKALRAEQAHKRALESWVPKTALGKAVKEGKEKNIDKILESSKKILEPEIVDILIPSLSKDLLLIGQSKGKFGGGKRRAWRTTQKKTMEDNVATFSCMAIVGDRNGHIGIGLGKSKETLPSREKALRLAKIDIIKITRGFESSEQDDSDPHTVPFVVEGKCGSVIVRLLPAPRGTGLVVADELKKLMRIVGIKDVYSKTFGHTRTTFNLAKAALDALSKTNRKYKK